VNHATDWALAVSKKRRRQIISEVGAARKAALGRPLRIKLGVDQRLPIYILVTLCAAEAARIQDLDIKLF